MTSKKYTTPTRKADFDEMPKSDFSIDHHKQSRAVGRRGRQAHTPIRTPAIKSNMPVINPMEKKHLKKKRYQNV